MRLFSLLLAIFGMIASTNHLAATEVTPVPRINVVFILADDLGWGDLSCYGQTKFRTPNIDQIASGGMRFTQHYSGAPVCAPSRCVLMTGKHLGHAEIRGNKQAKVLYPEFNEGQLPLSANVKTIAMQFREAGYKTAAFGKWGLGPVGSTGSPDQKGFELFLGYNCQAVAHSFFPPSLWRNSERIPLNTNAIPGHAKQLQGDIRAEDWVGENYAPDRLIEEAEAFLDQNQSNPFFLFLPFIEPHVAMHPPVDRLNEFPDDWDSKPYRGENGYLPHPRPRAAYAAMVCELDRYVGRILTRLETLNLTHQTLVIFTSDNGATHPGNNDPNFHVGGADIAFFQSNANLRGHKGSVHEGGIRVPMIAKLPKIIPSGLVVDTPTYFADWFPTLIEAVGLTNPPNDLDGESFWPLLTAKNQAWTRTNPMIWVFPEYGGQVAIRSANWKLIRKQLNQKRSVQDWELYQIDVDPSESNNVAKDHPAIVKSLNKLLLEQANDNRQFPVAIPTE